MEPKDYNKSIKLAETLIGNKYKYFCDMEHPLVNSNGYIYYHRHIMSLKLNRWILPTEVVHHIDENSLNNDPSNLEILTNSQHTRLHRESKLVEKIKKICPNCNLEFIIRITENTEHCSNSCAGISRRIFNISKENLEKMVIEMPISKIGEILGVTGNSVKKRCKKLGIPIRSRGYWQKVYAGKI